MAMNNLAPHNDEPVVHPVTSSSLSDDALAQLCEDAAEKVLETAPSLSSDPDESALQTLFWQLVAPNPTLLIEPTITELIRTAVDLDRARR
ncbi:hypothetical protein M3D63_00335 [Kocuria palustris]|uniref:hypothetical protein n=1 Tax=Kocuria palustris TaxID=71999 RepID=UPI0021A70C37|nr:hypothetical protein [Kocuria palustris]MCT1833234.1 hypothetical protein [Kocuria palustris]MDH5151991.1 hypothetical protein [Kocuria palustris]